MKLYHLFHFVQISPWPFYLGVASLSIVMNSTNWFKFSTPQLMFFPLLFLVLIMLIWFRDISREAFLSGSHSVLVKRGFYLGMLLFIFSEVMFFFSFFWTFFHSSLSPNTDIGMSWPPYYLEGISPFEIPLLNTLVLLSSGVTVTWSHYLVLENKNGSLMLMVTLVLGIYFTFLQFIEYKEALFCFSDSVFGNIFFMSTGFHGLHVIVGSLLLMHSLIRMIMNQFSKMNMIGFVVSIWYWHFVDVVWLFLFSFIYWWGN